MLNKAIDSIDYNTLVSLFSDELQPDTHLTGFLYAVSEEFVIIKHITPSGLYDGYVMVWRDDIFRIDAEGKYEQKIKALYDIKKQQHPILPLEKDLYCSLLQFCMTNNYLLCVQLNDSMIRGILMDFDDQTIFLQGINEYGENDGSQVVSIESVRSFSIDCQEEQDILLLVRRKTD